MRPSRQLILSCASQFDTCYPCGLRPFSNTMASVDKEAMEEAERRHIATRCPTEPGAPPVPCFAALVGQQCEFGAENLLESNRATKLLFRVRVWVHHCPTAPKLLPPPQDRAQTAAATARPRTNCLYHPDCCPVSLPCNQTALPLSLLLSLSRALSSRSLAALLPLYLARVLAIVKRSQKRSKSWARLQIADEPLRFRLHQAPRPHEFSTLFMMMSVWSRTGQKSWKAIGSAYGLCQLVVTDVASQTRARADPGKSYGFVYTSLSTILVPGWSGYLAKNSYCRSVLALVTGIVEIGEATVTLFLKKKIAVIPVPTAVGTGMDCSYKV